MKKAWRIVCALALGCLALGLLLAAVGFFTGGSPVSIMNHGSLDEFFERLRINWGVLTGMLPF